MCCGSWLDLKEVVLSIEEWSAVFFWIFDVTAEFMPEGVLSSILRVIWFSIMLWKIDHIVFPGVTFRIILV
jgi:hypothetical protein